MPKDKENATASKKGGAEPQHVPLALPIDVAVVLYDILCRYEAEDHAKGDGNAWRVLRVSAGGADARALHYLLEELAGRMPSPLELSANPDDKLEDIVAQAERRLLSDE